MEVNLLQPVSQGQLYVLPILLLLNLFFEIMKVTEFLTKLRQLNQEELAQASGIGQVIIDSLNSFLTSKRYLDLLDGFERLERGDQGLNLALRQSLGEPNLISGQDLSGQTMVITGTMEISRTQLKEKLEEYGVKVTSSVTKKTNYLLAGQRSVQSIKWLANLEC